MLSFTAPAFVVVPSAVVHGFEWKHESAGWVATLAGEALAMLAGGDPEIARLFGAARSIPIGTTDLPRASERMHLLARELGWSQPGRRAAVRSALLELASMAVRGLFLEERAAVPGRAAAIVARYRERVESRFRLREPVSVHAAALRIGEATLRSACARMAGLSPMAILDQRALLEARRSLIYSDLPIGEIGWSIGFGDPAYFSRFFARHVGCSPQRFRAKARR